MRRSHFILIVFIELALLAAQAQDRGTLTVTARVVTSVAIVMDQNGNPTVINANPADRRDNVSSVSYPSKLTESPKKSDPIRVRPATKRKAPISR